MNVINKLKNQSFFKDTNGNIVLWQLPNAPLWGWLLFKVLPLLTSSEQLRYGLQQISMAFIFTWAYLEMSDGVNYFRRLLGLIVLAAIVMSYF